MAYWRLRRVVESYRKAVGKSAKEIPDEIVELDRQIREQKRKIEELEAKGAIIPKYYVTKQLCINCAIFYGYIKVRPEEKRKEKEPIGPLAQRLKQQTAA